MVSLSFLQFLVADPDLRGGVSFGQGVGWGLPGGDGGGGVAGPLPGIRHWFLSSSSAVFVCKTPVTNNSQKSMVHV